MPIQSLPVPQSLSHWNPNHNTWAFAATFGGACVPSSDSFAAERDLMFF